MKTKQFFLTSLVLMVALVFTGCSAGGSENNEVTSNIKSITVAKKAAQIALDPIKASDALSIELLGNVLGGLYVINNDGKPELDLAESVTISEDGKTYTFTIRDVNWSNGTPLTSNDFLFAWRRMADPNTGSEWSYLAEMAAIKNASSVVSGESPADTLGISAPNSKTLVVELETPTPYFDSMISMCAFSPLNKEYVTSKGENFALTAEDMIYVGPFTVSEWDVASNTIKIAKNISYYDSESVDLDEVVFQVVPDAQQAVMSYENGDLDYISLTGDLVESYSDRSDYNNELGNFNWYMYFNNSVVDNLKLRQAIGYAINREDLTENVLKDGSIPGYNLVMKGLSTNADGVDFTDAPEVKEPFKYNVDMAKELWAEAQEETDLRSITLVYEDDSEFVSNVAAYVQASLESILEGFTVELKRVPKKTRIQNMKDGEYDVALHRWGLDYADPSAVLSLYSSASPYNFTGYVNEEFDSLLNDSVQKYAMDPENRWNVMVKAEEIMMESAISVPLFQTGNAVLLRDNIKNFVTHFSGVYVYYKYVTLN